MFKNARAWLLVGVVALIAAGAGTAQENRPNAVAGRLQTGEGNDELRLRDGSVHRGRAITLDDSTVVFRSGTAGTKVYNRSEVAAIILGGVPVATGSIPPGISAGEGFKVTGWHTFRRITNFQRGEDAKFIPDLRLSADGSKIGFNSHRGIFTMNADGTNLTRVSDIQAEYWDMTPDAKRLVWHHRERGIWVVNGDGGGAQKLPGELAPWALRITARGDKAILWAGERGALYSINTDGSDIKQITTMKAIAKAHGTVDENGNHFRYHGLAISDDGSRALLQFLWDLYAVDGTGVRKVTDFKTYGLSSFDISPDGNRVSWLDVSDPPEQKRKIEIVDWNGSGRRSIGFPASYIGAIQVINDGTVMGFLWESQGTVLRLHHPDGSINDLEFLGRGIYGPGMGNAAISYDGRRIAFTTEGPLSTDQGRPSQVWVCDIKPASIEGFPSLTNIKTFPRFLLTDGSTRSVATFDGSDKEPALAGAVLYPKNTILPHWDLRYYSYDSRSRDDGQYGDEKSGDGKFTNAGIYVVKDPKEIEPGPVMFRAYVRSKNDRMLVVDLEGMEVRRP